MTHARKPKPLAIEVLVRCSGDGREWDLGLEKVPAKKHKIVAGVLLEAAALLGAPREGRRPISLHQRLVRLKPPRPGRPS